MPATTQHFRSVESTADSEAEPVMISESARSISGLDKSLETRPANVFFSVTGLATQSVAPIKQR